MFKFEWMKHHDITFSFQCPCLSLLKSVYLVLLFMLILSALIHKSYTSNSLEANLYVAQADYESAVYQRCIETAVTNIPKNLKAI